jgi:4-hydroxyphenylpyruvate dioxygenase
MTNEDSLPLEDWDHVELWVGNAKQAAYYYEHAFGFRRLAYAGPETGVRDRASYVVRQGEVTLVLTNGLSADHEATRFVCTHGDGVRDIALRVRDAEAAYTASVGRGADGVREPEWVEDDQGRVQIASIATYGDVVHSFVARDDYAGPYLPGYTPVEENGRDPKGAEGDPAFGPGVAGSAADASSPAVGLTLLDHCVGNVELGKMNEWVGWYERVLGFENIIHYDDAQIHTEYSALMSKVMADGEGKIKFPINEPAEGRRKSQIAEYLEYNAGPGVQHVAIQTDDIVRTVEALEQRGIFFLRTPDAYYEDAFDRVGEIEESWADLRRLGILVDRDEDGYLLQIFTKPAQDRPTLFFEVIQRHGARTFGEGNFKALFEAIEREQALRGNL